MNISTRAKREKEQYNSGSLRRAGFDRFLSHSNKLLTRRILDDAKRYAAAYNGAMVLELGSQCWKGWMENFGIFPRELHCINISEAEIESGKKLVAQSAVKPEFHLMDAHELKFPDERFDLIFGAAILHHLDLPRALSEASRVLKPGGLMLFAEPLDINPLAKGIRYLTPKARTTDEQALRFDELRVIGSYFDASIISYQLLSVPLSCLSVMLFKDEANPLMKCADFLDTNIQRVFPFLRYYYRYALIVGRKEERIGKTGE